MLISDDYRQMNRALHQSKPTYGQSGHKWAEMVADWDDILDYGCGKGTLQKALNRPIAEYDPAIEGKDGLPSKHAYVVCTDVLEHIEPEHLDSVLAHIASLMDVAGLLVIATRPARKVLPDGRNAHLIVEDDDWWRAQLDRHFTIDSFEPASQEGEFVVRVSK